MNDIDLTSYDSTTFHQLVVFDEYNEFRSAVDILNNLCDNSLSYHDILRSKRSADHIFAFYLTVQLSTLIFDCYSYNTIANWIKKRRKLDSDNFEHRLINLSSDLATSKLK
ncbi:11962_t:CDS:2, partial [Funneliformis caledonium]